MSLALTQNKTQTVTPRWLGPMLLLAAVTAGLFALDILTPRGVAEGRGYVAAMVLCLWLPWRHAPIVYALIANLLNLAGLALVEGNSITFGQSVLNRSFGLVTVWIIAAILTQRLALEDSLRESRRRAGEAERARSALLRRLAEELRLPLNATIGYADGIARESFGPLGHAIYGDYARAIRENGARQLERIERVVELADIDLDPDAARPARLSAAGLLDRVARDLGQVLPDGVMLEVSAPSGPRAPAIRVDAEILRRVLLHLAARLARALPRGGLLRLSATPEGRDLALTLTSVDPSPAEPARPGRRRPLVPIFDGAREGGGDERLDWILCVNLVERQGGRLDPPIAAPEGSSLRLTFPIARRGLFTPARFDGGRELP